MIDLPIEEMTLAFEEHSNHDTLVCCRDMIYQYGLLRVLQSLADYVEDTKEAHALTVLCNYYKENEHAFCKDAHAMQ